MKMINKTLCFAFYLFMAMQLKAQEKKVTISGNFPQWNRGPVVLIYSENNNVVQDTTDIINGKFTFKLKLKEPSRLGIYSIASVQGKTKDNIGFYADEGTFTLKGSDSLARATINGSQITQDGIQLNREVTPIQSKLVDIRIKASGLSKDDSNYETEINKLNTAYKALIDTMIATKVAFIKSHPKSYLSLITLNEFLGGAIDYNFAFPLLSDLSPALKKTPLAKEMDTKIAIAKRTSIGAILPDFSSKDTSRNSLSLMEVAGKNKYTLIDFWASWCVPCRKENPNIVKAYQAFHKKGFDILSVSLDKSEGAWKKAINDDHMTWNHVSSLQFWDEPAAKLYGIAGVPDSFLIDSSGKIIARGLRAEELFNKLQDLLN